MFQIQNMAENSLVPDGTCIPSIIFRGWGIQYNSHGYTVFKRLGLGYRPHLAQSKEKTQQEPSMPTISMFYGILVSMYLLDTQKHHSPHIHVRYAEFKASIGIP
jgi:hypothetical protein